MILSLSIFEGIGNIFSGIGGGIASVLLGIAKSILMPIIILLVFVVAIFFIITSANLRKQKYKNTLKIVKEQTEANKIAVQNGQEQVAVTIPENTSKSVMKKSKKFD